MERTASELYGHLETERFHYLERGRDCAAVTIPHLLPKDGFNYTEDFNAPYFGTGAAGVNSLSASLLLALLPPNSPFFRLRLDTVAQQDLDGMEETKAEIEHSLSLIEAEIVAETERRSYRTALYQALRQLIVVGNVLLYFHDNGIKVIKLESYVVQRSPNGDVQKIVIREEVPEEKIPLEYVNEEAMSDPIRKTYSVFTCISYEDDMAYIHQEIGGHMLEGSYIEHDKEDCPYLALRFIRVDGENYGRSFCEELLGELQTGEALQQSIVEASAAMAKLLVLVSPTGLTRPRDIADAPNLSVRTGSASDVTFLQAQKHADLSVAQQTIASINDRLARQFMLAEGSIRNAERVTAAEIRMVQDQLERSLGGVFSLLSQELQLPMVRLLMRQMKEEGVLPQWPDDMVEPIIVTGVLSMGRSSDNLKLQEFIVSAQQALGPDTLAQHINVNEWFTRKAASLGIETKNLIKSPDEMAQEQQAQMQAQLQAQGGQQMIQSMGDVVKEQAKSTPTNNPELE